MTLPLVVRLATRKYTGNCCNCSEFERTKRLCICSAQKQNTCKCTLEHNYFEDHARTKKKKKPRVFLYLFLSKTNTQSTAWQQKQTIIFLLVGNFPMKKNLGLQIGVSRNKKTRNRLFVEIFDQKKSINRLISINSILLNKA